MKSAGPIDCKFITAWRETARATSHGVCNLSALSCPAAVSLVLAFNDKETRVVLDSVSKVVATNASVLTMGVRNNTLVDWRIGFVGCSETRQVVFECDEQETANEFSVQGICVGVSYGTRSSCTEIAIPISQNSECTGTPERIKGKVEFRDSSQAWGGSDYTLALEP